MSGDRERKLVVAALVRRDGKVLLSQRREDQSFPLQWELPGGKIEPGEAPPAALAREISEELDCRVEVGAIYDVLFHAYETFDLYMLVYACELAGEAKAHDVAAVEWVDIERDLSGVDILPADKPLVERLRRERQLA